MNDENREAIACAEKLKEFCKSKGNCYKCVFGKDCLDCWLSNKGAPQVWTIPPFKPTLSDIQKVVLSSFDDRCKWIIKNENGYVILCTQKPQKSFGDWVRKEAAEIVTMFKPEVFDFLSCDDKEPYLIADLSKEG